MSKFAENTTVPVERSSAEIERLIINYGASEFVSGWTMRSAQIMFEMHGKRIKFVLPLPDKTADEIRLNRYGKVVTQTEQDKRYEQECRQKWRALTLAIKAKLEAVESGIASFEEEFLPHFVVPGSKGQTVGEIMIPQLQAAYQDQRALPPLLTGSGNN